MRTLGKCVREYKNDLSEQSHVLLWKIYANCYVTVLTFNYTVTHIISPLPRQLCVEVMYIAMKLQQELLAMFPEAPDDILKVVGNLLYYRYMNPAIVAPDAFDVVDVGMDNQLSTDQVGVGVEWIVRSTILSDILIVEPGQHFGQ